MGRRECQGGATKKVLKFMQGKEMGSDVAERHTDARMGRGRVKAREERQIINMAAKGEPSTPRTSLGLTQLRGAARGGQSRVMRRRGCE